MSIFFLGVEVVEKEHTSDYEIFIKKRPSSLFFFKNPVLCGECDFKPYRILSSQSKKEFNNLCIYRYGESEPSNCEKIFLNEQLKEN